MVKNFLNKFVLKKYRFIIILISVIISAFFISKGCFLKKELNVAGEMFGKKITMEEFQKAVKETRLQALFNYGTLFNKIQHFLDIENQSWDQILLIREAKHRKIKISNKAVIKYISSDPRFQRQGNFNLNLYKVIIHQSLNTDPETFEKSIKNSLIIKKLYKDVTKDINISKKELFNEYKINNDQIKVSYISLSSKDFKKNINITQSESIQYYNTHKRELKVLPTVNIEYIQLDYPKDAGVQKKVETKFKAKAIYDEFNKGKSLKELSAKYKLPLKETGYYARENTQLNIGLPYGTLMEAFEMRQGQIKEPIKLDKGYIVMRSKDKRNAHIPAFSEIQNRIVDTLTLKKASGQTKIEMQRILDKIKGDIKNAISTKIFKKETDNMGFKVETTTLLPKKVIASILGIEEKNYKDLLDLNGNNRLSKIIQTVHGYCIVFVDNFKPADPVKFQKEKEFFLQQVIKQKKDKAFADFVKNLRDKAGLKTYTFKDFQQ